MIDTYRKLKRIALIDGRYYLFGDINNITENEQTIEIETSREYITIPKTAITRIEYFKEGAAIDWKR